MKTILVSIISSIVTMGALDAIWLKTMFPIFYNSKIGHLLATSPKFGPAIIFYIFFAIGLTVFIILPALSGNFSLIKIFILGALFGLVTYATYDLTNHATLRDWPLIVTIVDIIWGALLTGIISICTISIVKYFI